MIRHIFILPLIALLSNLAEADTLTWDFHHGWTKGHIITINSDDRTISINDRQHKNVKTLKMINAKNVIEYLKILIAKIPNGKIGQMAADGSVSKVVCVSKDGTTQAVVYDIDLPSAIYLNEGYTAKDELKNAAELKDGIDGFLIIDLLFRLQSNYFPGSEKR
jgi:hypothetical protein